MSTQPDTMDLLQPVARLAHDVRIAAKSLGTDEARFLVDTYYLMQEQRKRSGAQVRALSESGEPHDIIKWYATQWQVLENNLKVVLDKYSDEYALGRWAKSIRSIGPIITAGLLAHIDVTKPTAGNIWSFAGFNPAREWKKGEKRPHNADLKRLCFNIGECFVRGQGAENDVYGALFAKRKVREIAENRGGTLVDQAMARAEQFRAWKKTKSDAYRWYSGCYPAVIWDGYLELPLPERQKRQHALDVTKPAAQRGKLAVYGLPMLPPAHIHARARRWVVKLFLSHWHTVGHFIELGKLPPKPYKFAEASGHAHLILPPNAEKVDGLPEALASW